MARIGIRIADLIDPEIFKEKLHINLQEMNFFLNRLYGAKGFVFKDIYEEYMEYAREIKRFVADTASILNRAIGEGKNILFEGAQGTLLDVDHGTYPYVTSSNATAGGACTGTGVGPTRIDKVIGVVKAYTTRVGSGPFPTELKDPTGDYLREKGKEYGATTGRARRCGWFDSVSVTYSAMVNGFTGIALTKLDVLDEMEEIKICVAYRYRGREYTSMPAELKILEECKPIYETLRGWKHSISGISRYENLPDEARQYIERIEELTGIKVSLISTGYRREETIVKEKIF